MEKEPNSILLVFGENVKFGQGKEYLDGKSNKIGPIAKYVSIAAGNTVNTNERSAEVWFVGGDTAGNGLQESEQMEQYMLRRHPHHNGRTRVFTGLVDTSLQVEAVRNALGEFKNKNIRVSTVLPPEHRRRANGQLEAFGIKISRKYKAEREYVNDLDLSSKNLNRRLKVLKGIYKKMPPDFIREFGLNLIGKVDNKGLLIRKISKKFR